MTQRQANQLFEGPKVDMAALYSRTGMLYFLVCFYTPLVPVIPMIALVGILVQYWVEKYLLLRRHRVPETMGSAMAKFYAGTIPVGMILYAIGNYYFVFELSDEENDHGQWALWAMLAYYILPIGFILDVITVKVKRDETLKYDEAKFSFIQDYDRDNPMTENTAKAAYLRELQERIKDDGDEEKKKEVQKQLEEAEKADQFSCLDKYGKSKKGLETTKFDADYKKVKKERERNKEKKVKKRKTVNRYLQKLNKKFHHKDPENDGLYVDLPTNYVVTKNAGKKVLPLSNAGADVVHEHNDSDIPLRRDAEEAKKPIDDINQSLEDADKQIDEVTKPMKNVKKRF